MRWCASRPGAGVRVACLGAPRRRSSQRVCDRARHLCRTHAAAPHLDNRQSKDAPAHLETRLRCAVGRHGRARRVRPPPTVFAACVFHEPSESSGHARVGHSDERVGVIVSFGSAPAPDVDASGAARASARAADDGFLAACVAAPVPLAPRVPRWRRRPTARWRRAGAAARGLCAWVARRLLAVSSRATSRAARRAACGRAWAVAASVAATSAFVF